MLPRRIVPALLALGLFLLAIPADARKIALVIGNDSYKSVDALRNARADATAFAAALKDLGFDVSLKVDLGLSGMKAALRDLKNKVGPGDDIVFYFSGHGVQFEGTNYLVPVDIVPNDAMQVADDSVPLQRVLDDLRDQKTKFALAIVDACRDNPFKGTGRSFGSRGLAPVSAAVGQMVLYSAAAGQQALDRLGPEDRDPNGVFTRVLLKEMRKRGVSADRILKAVQTQVVELAKGAGHEQVPALYDQTIGDFYFLPPTGAAPAPAEVAALPAASAAVVPIVATGTRVVPAAASAAPARERGPFPAYVTSSLLPAGTQVQGKFTIHADGSFDYESTNGNHMHGSLLLSDPSNVTGTGMSSRAKILGIRPRPFPDGSTSTAVQLQGRIAEGKLLGTYRTKFETGEFVVTVGDWN